MFKSWIFPSFKDLFTHKWLLKRGLPLRKGEHKTQTEMSKIFRWIRGCVCLHVCADFSKLFHQSYWMDLTRTSINPFSNKPWFLRVWKQCGKRRNCSWRTISPFPAVFSTRLEKFLPFSYNLKLSSANPILKSLKSVVWENFNRIGNGYTNRFQWIKYHWIGPRWP